jgi:hypothetical protein
MQCVDLAHAMCLSSMSCKKLWMEICIYDAQNVNVTKSSYILISIKQSTY